VSDLSTTYLGLRLEHPIMPGAGPFVDDMGVVRRLEDSGAAAIVLRSLFEEQITREEVGTVHHMQVNGDSSAEALSYFPEHSRFRFGPDEYLEMVSRVHLAVGVPVIASLNGTTRGGWLRYAKQIEEAGAHALELNVYDVEADPEVGADEIEDNIIGMLVDVKKALKIPVAVKLSSFFTSVAHLARRLDEVGVDGLVLFNRFYQPDIDVEELEVKHSLKLSSSTELLPRLRWMAALSGRVGCSLAVTGGVHTPIDVVKSGMCGAHAVQTVSSLLQHGPEHLRTLVDGFRQWMVEHEYASYEQMRGNMSLDRCPDPHAYERANYVKTLLSWRGEL
jgi:dihydroorotate dehydrogenase (fumarate)